jgi:hypothetical protein
MSDEKAELAAFFSKKKGKTNKKKKQALALAVAVEQVCYTQYSW